MTNASKAKALLTGLGCESCMSQKFCKKKEEMYCSDYKKLVDGIYHMAPPVDRIYYMRLVPVKGDDSEDT